MGAQISASPKNPGIFPEWGTPRRLQKQFHNRKKMSTFFLIDM